MESATDAVSSCEAMDSEGRIEWIVLCSVGSCETLERLILWAVVIEEVIDDVVATEDLVLAVDDVAMAVYELYPWSIEARGW